MTGTDVVAVLGACLPERRAYGGRLAASTGRIFVPAAQLTISGDPAEDALMLARQGELRGGAVLEFPMEVPAADLIGSLADPEGPVRLVAVVCVLDAVHLMEDLYGEDYLARPAARGSDFTARALLVANQIEYASTVVVVNWAPLADGERSVVLDLIASLSPRARVRLHHGTPAPVDTSRFYEQGQDRPGWVGILNADAPPRPFGSRVGSWRYESVRPFHPLRLQRLLNDRIGAGEFGAVIRSAGFCRLASRPGVVAQWEHVGHMISFVPLARDGLSGGEPPGEDDEVLALGQDLALIGLDLDRGGLASGFDDAVLTDAELVAGPSRWAGFPDPFPAWAVAPGRGE